MAEAIADKSEEAKKPELSPEDKAKDVAASELLKEMEAEEKPDTGDEKKDEAAESEEEAGGQGVRGEPGRGGCHPQRGEAEGCGPGLAAG